MKSFSSPLNQPYKTYLAHPNAISLYLLFTATQVPSITSCAQTPWSCCKERNSQNFLFNSAFIHVSQLLPMSYPCMPYYRSASWPSSAQEISIANIKINWHGSNKQNPVYVKLVSLFLIKITETCQYVRKLFIRALNNQSKSIHIRQEYPWYCIKKNQ